MSSNLESTPTIPRGLSEEESRELRTLLLKAVSRVCPHWLREQREDIVQVGMMRVLDVLRRSETAREFSSLYLQKVAYSAIVDEIRRNTRRQEVPLDELADERRAAEPDPERQAVGRELTVVVRGCLKQLLPDRRAAVLLYIHGHQVGQIAELLNWGTKQAKNYLYRGLDDLRKCLASKGVRSAS